MRTRTRSSRAIVSRTFPRACAASRRRSAWLHTIERTRQALLDPRAFYERTIAPRLRTMLAHGTTTLETKTGYALHKPGETALLDLIAQHRDDPDVPRLVATFLGAHALPPEFTREERVRRLPDRPSHSRGRSARRRLCRCVLRAGILFARADATLP